jgi:hypothetical protein
MAELPAKIEQSLSEVYGLVGAHFTITDVPQGGAPHEIKEQWVGVTLPVRAAHLGRAALAPRRSFEILTQQIVENDDPVSVTGLEAVHGLREAGREEAADFWAQYQLALFTFRAHEGLLVPVES